MQLYDYFTYKEGTTLHAVHTTQHFFEDLFEQSMIKTYEYTVRFLLHQSGHLRKPLAGHSGRLLCYLLPEELATAPLLVLNILTQTLI